MASKDEIKEGIEILKHGLEQQAPMIADILFSPIKHHAKDCQCDPCLISIKRRAQRAANIKRKQDKS